MGKNKISISVAGSEFVVSTDAERDYTISLAETVDSKIRALMTGNPKLNVGLAAILCALDLCDENEKNKESCARLRDEIRLYLEQLEEANQRSRSEQLERLERENDLLRNQLAQYQQGQMGFHS